MNNNDIINDLKIKIFDNIENYEILDNKAKILLEERQELYKKLNELRKNIQ